MQKRIALVYYSQRGTTAKLAGKLAQRLAIVPIVLEEESRKGFDIVSGKGGLSLAKAAFAAKLGLKGRLRPFNAETAARIADADMVVLGTPVWAASTPPAINAFIFGRLKAGAKVCAFGTMQGRSADKAIRTLRKRIERRGGRMDEHLFVSSPDLESEETSRRVAEFLSRLD